MRSKERKAPRGQRDMSCGLHEWRFQVGSPDHGNRLDTFLSARLSWRSRRGVQSAIRVGRVEVLPFRDPRRASVGRLRSSLRLRVGQEVVVRLPAPQAEAAEGAAPAAPPPARVVFENRDLLAVDKPPHRSVYPSRRHRVGSLIEWVHLRHRRRSGPDGYFPTPCHRLDRETSGLVLFAKNRDVRVELSRQFEERSIRKTYLAVVDGHPKAGFGVVDARLGLDRSSVVEARVGVDPEGREAVTRWRRIGLYRDTALLELEPETGRRHQLRAHLASIGCPIVGDKLYGGGDAVFLRSLEGGLTDRDRARLRLGRQALHAWRLELQLGDGASGKIRLEAPLAADIEELLDDQELETTRCVAWS